MRCLAIACRLTPPFHSRRRMLARQRHQSCPRRCCVHARTCATHPRRSPAPRTRRCCAAWASSCRTCGWAVAAARSCAERRAGAIKQAPSRRRRCDLRRRRMSDWLAHAGASRAGCAAWRTATADGRRRTWCCCANARAHRKCRCCCCSGCAAASRCGRGRRYLRRCGAQLCVRAGQARSCCNCCVCRRPAAAALVLWAE